MGDIANEELYTFLPGKGITVDTTLKIRYLLHYLGYLGSSSRYAR